LQAVSPNRLSWSVPATIGLVLVTTMAKAMRPCAGFASVLGSVQTSLRVGFAPGQVMKETLLVLVNW